MTILSMFVAASAAAGMPSGELDAAFQILCKGSPIGSHVVDVVETAEGARVETRIDIRVKFGPLPLYRYKHRSTEFWRDGALVSVEGKTNDNGRRTEMKAWRDGERLMVEGDAFTGMAPVDAVISSYWNRAALSSAAVILSTQDGDLIDVDSRQLGLSRSPSGEEAEHLRIAGTLALDLWYSGDAWTGANFVIDGEELTYVPMRGGKVFAAAD